MRQYDYILFDMDGTLADTPDFHNKVFIDYFTEQGKVFDPQKIIDGLKYTHSIKDVFKDAGVRDEEEAQEVFRYLRRFYQKDADEMIEEIPLARGAKETLEKLHEKGYSMALISNSMQELLNRMLKLHGMEDYFFAVTGAKEEDAEKKERFRNILKEHGIAPEKVLYVGDTNGDMSVAHELGCAACFADTRIAWVRDKEALLKQHKPEYVIGGIDELTAILD